MYYYNKFKVLDKDKKVFYSFRKHYFL